MPDEFDKNMGPESQHSDHDHKGIFAVLVIGLVLAIGANIYLLLRSSQMSDQIADMRDTTQAQITKLGAATTSLLEQRLQTLNDALSAQVKGTQDTTTRALKQAQLRAVREGEELKTKIEDEQQKVGDQIVQLKDAATTADSKISAVSTDVTGVKTDVSGVKAEVATTQAGLQSTAADLKRAMGDMGVMSGLIATNAKDLVALRELGERNYFEFDLRKGQAEKRMGDVVLTMKKSDPKRNRFTVTVLADDKLVEKRDKTINEPVQVYVHAGRQPYEIVVNQVKKDEIVGYLSTPKVVIARQ